MRPLTASRREALARSAVEARARFRALPEAQSEAGAETALPGMTREITGNRRRRAHRIGRPARRAEMHAAALPAMAGITRAAAAS